MLINAQADIPDIQHFDIQHLQNRAEKALKLILGVGATDAVVSFSNTTVTQIKFANSSIVSSYSWDYSGLGIFGSFNKRIISTSVKNPNEKSIEKAVSSISLMASKVPENKEYNGIASGKQSYKSVSGLYDRKVKSLGSKAIDVVHGQLERASDFHGRSSSAVKCAGVFEYSYDNSGIITSEGIEAKDKGTDLYFSMRVMKDSAKGSIKGQINRNNSKNQSSESSQGFYSQDFQSSGHMVECSRVLSKFNPSNATDFACNIAESESRLDKVNLPQGKYTILFSPFTAANMVDPLGHAASIFAVESGMSHLAGKLSKKVASSSFSLYDKPLLPNGIGSTSFDAEGHSTKDRPIISDGRLVSYLYNTSFARKYARSSGKSLGQSSGEPSETPVWNQKFDVANASGNAGLISPNPFNLVVPTSDMTEEELIESVKKGLYITNVWYTRFQNHSTGDFSTIPRDGCFFIKNGKIAGSVKGIRLSDNLQKVFMNASMYGKKSYQIRGWEVETPCVTPHILSKDLNISKPFS